MPTVPNWHLGQRSQHKRNLSFSSDITDADQTWAEVAQDWLWPNDATSQSSDFQLSLPDFESTCSYNSIAKSTPSSDTGYASSEISSELSNTSTLINNNLHSKSNAANATINEDPDSSRNPRPPGRDRRSFLIKEVMLRPDYESLLGLFDAIAAEPTRRGGKGSKLDRLPPSMQDKTSKKRGKKVPATSKPPKSTTPSSSVVTTQSTGRNVVGILVRKRSSDSPKLRVSTSRISTGTLSYPSPYDLDMSESDPKREAAAGSPTSPGLRDARKRSKVWSAPLSCKSPIWESFQTTFKRDDSPARLDRQPISPLNIPSPTPLPTPPRRTCSDPKSNGHLDRLRISQTQLHRQIRNSSSPSSEQYHSTGSPALPSSVASSSSSSPSTTPRGTYLHPSLAPPRGGKGRVIAHARSSSFEAFMSPYLTSLRNSELVPPPRRPSSLHIPASEPLPPPRNHSLRH
ncbi:hypothetical protein DFS34DRAFT_611806 [Phlyctochytrium arcticum]|nr:hypothetical protein DFS34DRAFT_611806 [Phlyctochytrium arcticum]